MNAVDTNILIYSVDRHDPEKQMVAQELLRSLQGEETVLPWQVLCETARQMRRWADDGRISPDAAEQYIETFREIFPIETPDQTVFDHATYLYRRFSLSHWDSLLIAACACVGVTKLYTEDMASGATFDGLQIVSPFPSSGASRKRPRAGQR